jgi:hypothetical protein
MATLFDMIREHNRANLALSGRPLSSRFLPVHSAELERAVKGRTDMYSWRLPDAKKLTPVRFHCRTRPALSGSQARPQRRRDGGGGRRQAACGAPRALRLRGNEAAVCASRGCGVAETPRVSVVWIARDGFTDSASSSDGPASSEGFASQVSFPRPRDRSFIQSKA